MRSLIRKAGLWFTIAILGVIVWDRSQKTDPWVYQEEGGIVEVVGIIMVGFGTILGLNALFAAIGLARMKRGYGVIAKWSISADDWVRFRDFEIQSRQNRPNLITRTVSDTIIPIKNVDVIVGRRQIIIGHLYYSLRPFDLVYIYDVSLINGPPLLELLEFRLTYGQSAANAGSTTTLHIPVPLGSHDDATNVYKHYQMLIVRLGLPLRHPWRMVKFAVAVALASSGLALVGYHSEFSGAAGRYGDLMMRIGIPVAIGAWGFALAISIDTIFRRRRRGSGHD